MMAILWEGSIHRRLLQLDCQELSCISSFAVFGCSLSFFVLIACCDLQIHTVHRS